MSEHLGPVLSLNPDLLHWKDDQGTFQAAWSTLPKLSWCSILQTAC